MFKTKMLIASAFFFISHFSFSQNSRPSIIFIMTDDMGYGDLSCYGGKEVHTPNIDKLAKEGMKFTQSYSAGTLCTPTRAAFMTGLYPGKTSVGLFEPLETSRRDSAYGLSANDPSVAKKLKVAGYETALIGKWHLGFLPEFSPMSNGFDYFFGIKAGGADYISYMSAGIIKNHDLYENEKPVYTKGYLTHLIAEKSVQFINKSHPGPFFLSIQFNAPHWPWQRPQDPPYHDTVPYRLGGNKEIYYEMMKELDNAVGRIMSALDKKGLTKNTLVIFTNDNGGERFSEMGGLMGFKYSVREGGIRVPAIVRWPGVVKASATSEQPVITMDWHTTIVHAAGGDPGITDGVNLLPILKGQQPNFERTFYWRTTRRIQGAIRKGDWKYLKDELGEFLYNVEHDPYEWHDYKNRYPDLFKILKEEQKQWESNLLVSTLYAR